MSASVSDLTYTSAVQSFLDSASEGHYIGGRMRRSAGGGFLPVIDPGTGRQIAEIPEGAADDIAAAVAAAKDAFERSDWPRMTAAERGVILQRLADLVERDSETLALIETLDVGKPLAQARFDVANFVQTMRYYVELALHVRRREPIPVPRHEARTVWHPVGVCGFILPWNFPFLLAGWNLSPALAAGNCVVLKPAEDTSLSSLYLARLAAEAGVPDGVLNIVTGRGEEAGAALARHPDLNRMGFTGSPEVGRMVAAECGRNLVPVKLELGGKGAAVIFEDADIEATAQGLASAITLNTGQVCCTATRWVVHEGVYDRFVDRTMEVLSSVRTGHGGDEQTQMGPLVSSKQHSRVTGYVSRARKEGAEAVLGGDQPEKVEGGFFVKPALLAGEPSNVGCREEIFGPVAFLLRFRSEDEAVDLVNQSRYGLANSVWTADPQRADRVAERLVAGNSWINAHNVFVHGVPYAGVNLSGLGGGVLGPETLFDYLRRQSVVRPS